MNDIIIRQKKLSHKSTNKKKNRNTTQISLRQKKNKSADITQKKIK